MNNTTDEKEVPEWLLARRERVAEALRQAHRKASMLFGYMWDQWSDEGSEGIDLKPNDS